MSISCQDRFLDVSARRRSNPCQAGSIDFLARNRHRGVGDWTAHYIALRAAREPDAFPASDVGLLRGAANRQGVWPSAAELAARAARWRPWRAYAA